MCHLDTDRFGFGEVVDFVEPEGRKGEWWWEDPSGHNPGPYREELTRLVEGIESGEIQAVIVYKLNRLVRDNGIQDALSKLFRRYGVHLIVGGRDMEIDTARGKYNAAQEAARAAEYRDQIEEDVERDLDYKFMLGQFTRNPSCYGVRSKGPKSQAIVFVDQEVANIRKIYEWFLGIGCRPLGIFQVAQKCMREGIRVAVGAKGHHAYFPDRVRSTQIRSILGNCMYKGYWQHNGERKPYPQLLLPPADGIGDPQPIVSPDIWELAQVKLADKKTCGKKAASSKRLLTGLAICGSCGQPCHANVKNLKNGGQQERWICPRRKGIERICFSDSFSSIFVPHLDEWVIDYLAPMLALEIQELLKEAESAPLRRELESLTEKLKQVRLLETEKLKAALSVLDDDQFAGLAASFRDDREALEQRISTLRPLLADDCRRIPANPRQLLEQDPGLLQDALNRCLHWIALTKEGVVAYSKLNRYIAGRYVMGPNDAEGRRQGRTVAPPDLETISECSAWFTDPSEFIAGRRYALGDAASRLTDIDLLPFEMTVSTPK